MKTKSEILFEGFLTANNLPFEKIQEQTTRTPDYRISVGGSEIIFELKELAADKNFGVVKDPAYPHIKSKLAHIGRSCSAQDRKLKEANPVRGQTENSLGSLDLQQHRSGLSVVRHRAHGLHGCYVRCVHDPRKQRDQGRIGLVQRQGPDAPGNEKHVVQRRRPSIRPGWKDDGHALRERLRQGQNSLRPVAPLL